MYVYKNGNWKLHGSMKGEKGEQGDNLHIDLVIDSVYNLTPDDEVNKFALDKNSLNLYYNDDGTWLKIGNIKGQRGMRGEQGEKGEKGDKGTGLKVDIVVNELEDLLEMPYLSDTFALTKDTMNIWYIGPRCAPAGRVDENECNSCDLSLNQCDFNEWELIGNIKGDKGDKGDKGEQGPQGTVGRTRSTR